MPIQRCEPKTICSRCNERPRVLRAQRSAEFGYACYLSYCRECALEWRKAHHKKHPEKLRALIDGYEERYPGKRARILRNWSLKNKYGITIQQYEELFDAQDGVCAICRKPQSDGRKKMLAVDHDHKTGVVRGLLCSPCNLGLGIVGDDIAGLEAVIVYLKAAYAKAQG